MAVSGLFFLQASARRNMLSDLCITEVRRCLLDMNGVIALAQPWALATAALGHEFPVMVLD